MSTPTIQLGNYRPIALAAALAVLFVATKPNFAQDAAATPSTPAAAPPATTTPEVAPAAPETPPPVYKEGDIAWMLVASALVLMMTAPGLFLFYGGLVRKKNVLSVFMQCLFLCGLNSLLWVVVGYSLAFGESGPQMFEGTKVTKETTDGKEVEVKKPQKLSCFGGFDKVMLKGVSPELDKDGNPFYKPSHIWSNVPEELFMIFQMMFYIITPALICGAFAERMKFSAMVLFTALWGLLVYCPLAHWVWSGDTAFLGANGPFPGLDFAGGLVVHASSGISALVCAIFLGKRLGYGKEPIVPHNMTYTAIGAALLWVGWFGFNAGSEIAADTKAVNAFVITHICAASALLAWTIAEWLIMGKPTVLGASSGIVAGLVVITPASGFVTPTGAIFMGLIAGVICFLACAKLKPLLGYDDSLDAFGVHGIGGITGAILTGVFASEAVMGKGMIPNNVVVNQLVGVGITAAVAIVGSVLILTVLKFTIGLRVSEESELEGLDSTEHGESGYVFN